MGPDPKDSTVLGQYTLSVSCVCCNKSPHIRCIKATKLFSHSTGGQKSEIRVLSDFTFTFHFPALEKEMATHSSVLAWRIPGTGEPGGCHLWGHTESDMTEVT